MGINRSLELPDKTLQFIRDRPLMDEAIRPLTGRPLLVKRGALLTRIVVDSVLALDGQRHDVMFIGTGKLDDTQTELDTDEREAEQKLKLSG